MVGFVTKVGLGWDTGAQVLTTLGTSALLFVASPLLIRKRGDETALTELYARLDRPVDVDSEVSGAENTARDLLGLLGVLTLVMTGLVAAMFVFEAATGGAPAGPYAGVLGVMLAVGVACLLSGRGRCKKRCRAIQWSPSKTCQARARPRAPIFLPAAAPRMV